MASSNRPRQARVTDQDLLLVLSKIDHVTQQLDSVLDFVEEQRRAQGRPAGSEHYPGVGYVGAGPRTEPSDVQRRAAEAAERAEALAEEARLNPQPKEQP